MIDLKTDLKIILKEELNKNKIVYEDNDDLFKFMIMYYDVITRIPVAGKKYYNLFK